jgi:hypothetical protein
MYLAVVTPALKSATVVSVAANTAAGITEAGEPSSLYSGRRQPTATRK